MRRKTRAWNLLSQTQHNSFSNVSNSDNGVKNIINNNRILLKDLGDGIYNVQLNRPAKYNALDMQMFESIGQTISILQKDYKKMNVRCIILSGNGKAFCTGLDVKSIIKPGGDGNGIANTNANATANDDDGTSSSYSSGFMMPHTKMNRLLERPSGYDQRERESTGVDDKKGIGNLAQDVAFLWRSMPIPVIA